MPRLKKIYDERWQNIQGTRIEAIKIHRQAEDLTAAYEKELEDTRCKASNLISARLREISQATIDEKNIIMADMKKKFVKGELFLSERKMKAFLEAQPVAQMLASEIIMKLARDRISYQTVKTMVSQSFKNKAMNDL